MVGLEKRDPFSKWRVQKDVLLLTLSKTEVSIDLRQGKVGF